MGRLLTTYLRIGSKNRDYKKQACRDNTLRETLLRFLWKDFSAPSGSPLACETAFSHVVSAIIRDFVFTKLGWMLEISDTGAMALICDNDSGVSVMSRADNSDSAKLCGGALVPRRAYDGYSLCLK